MIFLWKALSYSDNRILSSSPASPSLEEVGMEAENVKFVNNVFGDQSHLRVYKKLAHRTKTLLLTKELKALWTSASGAEAKTKYENKRYN